MFEPLENGGVLIDGFPAYAITPDGKVWTRFAMGGKSRRALVNFWREKIPCTSKRGYRRVELYSNGRKKKFFAHRLVLESFVGKCPAGMECCHEDGNPRNNSITNLRWDTPVANWNDRRDHGTATIGSKQSQAKLSESDVLAIKASRADGVLLRVLAKQYGVSIAKIGQITTGKNWSHING